MIRWIIAAWMCLLLTIARWRGRERLWCIAAARFRSSCYVDCYLLSWRVDRPTVREVREALWRKHAPKHTPADLTTQRAQAIYAAYRGPTHLLDGLDRIRWRSHMIYSMISMDSKREDLSVRAANVLARWMIDQMPQPPSRDPLLWADQLARIDYPRGVDLVGRRGFGAITRREYERWWAQLGT